MPSTVVGYDPDGILSPSFTRAAALGDVVIKVARAPEAHRLAEHAMVIVLAAGKDNAIGLGFLASLGELRSRLFVLVSIDARQHRRLVIRAIRRGAAVLIEQPPDALIAFVRSVVMPGSADLPADSSPSMPASRRSSWMDWAATRWSAGAQECSETLAGCMSASGNARRVTWSHAVSMRVFSCPFRDDVRLVRQ